MAAPPFVHALLLSEFDIDRGSTLRATVPPEFISALPTEANVIAECMLPEGGHNRSSDTTVFIFNREVRVRVTGLPACCHSARGVVL